MEYDRKGIKSPWGGKDAPLNKQYCGKQNKIIILIHIMDTKPLKILNPLQEITIL